MFGVTNITTIIMKIALSKEQNHLVFTKTEFDEDGLQTSQKRAILEISPDRDPDEVLAVAQEKEWEIYGAVENGFCKVRKLVKEIA